MLRGPKKAKAEALAYLDTKMRFVRKYLARYDPFGGVRGVQWILHHRGMDKTREFWLRLGVIVGALILMSSAMVAFFG